MDVGETHEATVIDIRQNPVQINRRGQNMNLDYNIK